MTAQARPTVPLDFADRTPEEAARRAADFADLMGRRRTVRDFSDRPVPRALIADCLRAAVSAPSGANQQPWHFVAIGDGATKARIRLAAEAEERAFYAGRAGAAWLAALAPLGTDARKPFLEVAPWVIVIFAARHGLDSAGNRIKHYYVNESVGIATGLLIAALHNAGLATLTHTPSPMGFLTDICGRPANEKPVMLVVAGYPAPGARVPAIARKPARETITWIGGDER
ncbi:MULTISPECIES: nitroreductase family protein [unclassified Roseitalea]|uniref:nitroreductase family protein n=1 Tax=unclassified Roseitalea TaxID=2639107 RepID=UPI00273ED30D|nr:MULTISPECIES: nitroreductase family protein [unclassified Roseitalea]